jgi:hypothetical protein
MLYLLGGASRAGKSTIARRCLSRDRIPYFSLDVLMMGLANGWPTCGVDPNTSSETRASRLWPVIRAMAVNLLEEERVHPSYLLEGDVLLPRDAVELASEYPGRVRSCFVGYTRADPVSKLRSIRAAEPDWYDYAPDAEALAFLGEQVDFSRYLERECAAHAIPYFDVSLDPSALDSALDRLVGVG